MNLFNKSKRTVNISCSDLTFSDEDTRFMEEALKLAREAFLAGEVPVGAVIVCNGKIIGKGRNHTEENRDPTAHAEMSAIKEALQNTDGFRLTGCDIYVTLEPCSMCAGALVHSRVDRIIIGASDPKTGACGSVLDITGHPSLNHHPSVVFGVKDAECATVLRDFFKERREVKKLGTLQKSRDKA